MRLLGRHTLGRFITLTLLGLVTGGKGICQPRDLYPGYVIAKGDTVRGYLDIGKDPWNLAEVILFANRNGKTPQSFQSAELDGFGVDPTDEHFVRKTVRIEATPMNLAPQQELPKIKWVTKKVFIRVLVRGELDLYSYHDSKWHFLTGADDSLNELIYIEYKPYGYKDALVYNRYKKQLDSLTAGCREGTGSGLLYREGPIVSRVREFDRCNSTLQYVRTRGKPYFNLTLLFGQTFNNTAYTGISNTQPISANFLASEASFSSMSTNLYGGSIDFSRRQKAKVKLNVEIVSRPTGTFTATNGEIDPQKVRRDYFIELGYTHLGIGFKTRVVRGNTVQVNLLGGYRRTLSTNLRTYEVLNIQSSSPFTFEPMADFDTTGSGFLAGLQATYKRFSLLTRWETISFTTSSSGIRIDSFSVIAGASVFPQ